MKAVASAYRAYLRETRQLPHVYLRQFFRLTAGDNCRNALATKCDALKRRKLKRIYKTLQQLRAANNGSHLAFNRVLDLAYGRVGRLRWELMEPLLSNPNLPRPMPIIHNKESSRPPVYSPELTALLTSGLSRKKRPLVPGDLNFPPILPERADPNSFDAKILGPFSKRREVNARWKYFRQESKKIFPPLQVSLSPDRDMGMDQGSSIILSRIRKIGFEGTPVLEELVKLATKPKSQSREGFDGHLPTRWLRRRYQELLGRLPILTFIPAHEDTTARRPGGFVVSLAPNALKGRTQGRRIPNATDDDVAWNRKDNQPA